MAERFDHISEKIGDFIQEQKIFFVATADLDGRVNVSPKGADSLRLIDQNRVLWLNLTGSGNETAAHLPNKNRITLMFCSFTEKPLILRLYGQAKTVLPKDEAWEALIKHFPDYIGARQIFDVNVELVQTSCGYQVPYFDFVGERDMLDKWANNRGREGIKDYWKEKNQVSLDGKDITISD